MAFEIRARCFGSDPRTIARLLAGRPTSIELPWEDEAVLGRALRLTRDVTVVVRTSSAEVTEFVPQVAVSSFDERVLHAVRRRRSKAVTTLIFDEPLRIATVASTISPRHDLVTRDLVRVAHALDVRVVPWTVNDVRSMVALIELGVDGFVTDEPALAQAVFDARTSLAA